MRPSVPSSCLVTLLVTSALLVGCNLSSVNLQNPTVPALPTTPPTAETSVLTLSPTATAPAAPGVSLTALKYRLVDEFGKIFFCDPDLYPVARGVSDREIEERIAAIRANADEYRAILEHLGLQDTADLSPAQNRLIEGEHKRLNAIQLEPTQAGFNFALRTSTEAKQGFAIKGFIATDGTVTISERQSIVTQCPICLAGSTLIDTPTGPTPIRDLREGMPVWTARRRGERVQGIVVRTVRRPVPAGVLILRLVLDDGRELLVSPGHPDFNGQLVGELAVGDPIDGARVSGVALVELDEGATYDILASGETGAYWANGVLMASTIGFP